MSTLSTKFNLPILAPGDATSKQAYSAALVSALEVALARSAAWRFGNQAAMDSSTGAVAGDMAVVTAIPGATFIYNGTSWDGGAEGIFASVLARDAAITAPRAGFRVRRTDTGWTEQYMAAGAVAAGWYPVAGARPAAYAVRATDLASGTSTGGLPVVWTAPPTLRGFTWVVGQPTRITSMFTGRCIADALAKVGSTASASASLRINGTDSRTVRTVANSSGVSTIRLAPELIDVNVGDYFELMTQSDSTWSVFAGTAMNIDHLNAR